MEAKTEQKRPSSSGAAKTIQQVQLAPGAEADELDYTPKKMTPRQTLIVSLKLAAVSAVVFALLWLAHVKLEK